MGPVDADAPATSGRQPRRSFRTSFGSFGGGVTAVVPSRAPVPGFRPQNADAVNRVSDMGGDISHGKALSPEEVYDLAKSLESPIAIPEGGFKGAELKRRKSVGAGSRRSSQNTPDAAPPLALEPVEYTVMGADEMLPYADRPSEVAELMQNPKAGHQFDLLSAAFPKTPLRPNWRDVTPTEWSWAELVQHLTKVSRRELNDYHWVLAARTATRARSVALWEKIGAILGCDGDLLTAGDEEEPGNQSWGGLGLGEEGEYDESMNQVFIEGLEALDPAEMAKAEEDFRQGFGDIVEDEGEAGLMTIGEEPGPRPEASRPKRTKSFVGLQITTSPPLTSTSILGFGNLALTPLERDREVKYDRGPGAPLFPSTFTSLRSGQVGRSASVGLAGGVKATGIGDVVHPPRWGLGRKPSGAGLSESESVLP